MTRERTRESTLSVSARYSAICDFSRSFLACIASLEWGTRLTLCCTIRVLAVAQKMGSWSYHDQVQV